MSNCSGSMATKEVGVSDSMASSNHTAIDQDSPVLYPNGWSKLRPAIREPAAEFLGTMVLVLIGTAGNAQGVLFDSTNVSPSPAGSWLSVAFGWGVGIGVGACVSGGVSGGHINPAVTIALATFRGFPWRKVPIYVGSQLLGAVAGAAVTYANYFQAITLYEGGAHIRSVPGTASLFGTYASSYLSNVSAFFDEFIGTFILMLVILACTDKRNGPPPAGLLPIVLFITLFGIGMTFGAQTGFAVNPARDLGPRILTAMVGYGKSVFTFRHQYWLWCGILAPVSGALVAAGVYDLFVFTGCESVVNAVGVGRRRQAATPQETTVTMPAGVDAV